MRGSDGTYLSDGNYFIENSNKSGWYLFDIEQNNSITKLTWFNDPIVCITWSTKESAEQFMKEKGIKHQKISVVAVNDKKET